MKYILLFFLSLLPLTLPSIGYFLLLFSILILYLNFTITVIPNVYPRSLTFFLFFLIIFFSYLIFYFFYIFFSRAKMTLRAKVCSFKNIPSCIFDLSCKNVFVNIRPVPDKIFSN